VIHFKDYIKDSAPSMNKDSIQKGLQEDNLVNFPEQDYVSREYIGKFVDQLMSMPDDPHRDIAAKQDNPFDPFNVVASRILSEEKW
jgi:hypothetical protein